MGGSFNDHLPGNLRCWSLAKSNPVHEQNLRYTSWTTRMPVTHASAGKSSWAYQLIDES